MQSKLKGARRNRPTEAGGRQGLLDFAVTTVLIVLAVSLSACSTFKGTPEGTWRANFFKSLNGKLNG